MNTDRRIYLTTALIALAAATAITAFARWAPLQGTIDVSAPPQAAHVAFQQAPAEEQPVAARM